jgi:hypothetical protein
MCDIDDTDNTMFALTWHGRGGPLYWSTHKGWTPDVDKAWVLSAVLVDSIEADDKLMSMLPQHKERRDGANWEPIYLRLAHHAPGVTDDDFMENR